MKKTIASYIGILCIGMCGVRAEYPSIEVLLEKLHNIPSAYKELIVQQRAVEEGVKTKGFGGENKELRPKFCFEETTKGEKFTRPTRNIDFLLHCIDPKVGAYDLLFNFFTEPFENPLKNGF